MKGDIKMNRYNGASICLNGHVISKYDSNYQKHCSQCGAKVISICPKCQKSIRGLIELDFAYIGSRPYTRPDYCYNCGEPYPWTESAIESVKLLIQEEEEFSEQLKSSIIESLPDVITDTPKTNLASVRLKKGIASAGKFTADAIRQFVIDFGCEMAKKSLGL